MASIEDIRRIFCETIDEKLGAKLKPIQDSVAILQKEVAKLEERKKPDHLPDTGDVTWKSAGAKKQYEAWSESWDYFYDALGGLDSLPDSVKESTQVTLNKGKKHAEENMRDILLGNHYGWDFLEEYRGRSSSLAMGPQDEEKMRKVHKVVEARRQRFSDSP